MTQATKTRKPAKTVTIIARFAWKNINRVCYQVRGSDGEKYQVLFNGTQPATCTCKGFKAYHKCYHVAQLTEKEQARREAAAPAAETVETTPVAEVLAAAQATMIALDQEQASTIAQAVGTFYEERFAVQALTYGTCGHLSKNENDACGACRSRKPHR